MSHFVTRRPLIFSVLAVLAPVVALKCLHVGLGVIGLSELGTRLVAEVVFGAYVVALLWRLHWWRDAGFTRAVNGYRLVAWLPLLLLPLLILVGSGIKPASLERMAGFALLTLLVGFAEEGLMRGIVLRALSPAGVMRAAVLSSLIFGLGHLANIVQGVTPSAAIVQAVVATLLGIGFAGARVYAGTIWPAIVLHAFTDLVDTASRGFMLPPPQVMTVGRAVVPIALTSVCAVYGWWLLRRDLATL